VQTSIQIATSGQGLHNITAAVVNAVEEITSGREAGAGLVNLFLQHTSASLLIQENADPTAKRDLEEFLNRLVPEGQSWHRHLDEGPDDTVSHMKASLTATSLTLPYRDGKLLLGTWQGLYLWEHRRAPHKRRLIVTALI
jgi:secondary thiamine-phosphate synthase enzyme